MIHETRSSLIHAFLQKASSAGPSSPQMRQAPELERADALAAAHMIEVARRDAQNREFNAMRQILAHGVSWDELAEVLDTTAEQLWDSARRHGARPETWTVPATAVNRNV